MKLKLLLTVILLNSVAAFSQTALFEWAGKMGSTSNDHGESISVDSLGNVYVIGSFYGTVDFDPGTGVTNLVSNGGKDIFIQKLDSAGALIWAKNIGGSGDDAGLGIVVDSGGAVYATGDFTGTVDFDPGAGAFNQVSAGSRDMFVLSLSSTGSFNWVGRSGSTSWDGGRNIFLATNGDVLVSGWFHGTIDLDMGVLNSSVTSAGNLDGFLLRMTSSGSFVWGKRIGGSGFDTCFRLVEDNSGDIFVTGVFEGTSDFDPGSGSHNVTSSGGRDGYLLKIDSLGSFLWVKKFGGTGSESGNFLDVDGIGNVYLQGKFQGTVDFDSGPSNTYMTSAGSDDVFIVKFNTSGSLQWARKFGGTGSDLGQGLKTDYLGNTYVTGHFQGTCDFDPSTSTYNLSSNGSYDIYICKLSMSGNFVWARSIGGSGYDSGKAIEITGSGSIVATGWFRNTVDFDANSTVHNLSSSGGDDVYVTKFRVCYPTSSSITASACSSYSSPSGNYTWTTSGTYTDVFSNAAGCDSVVTVNLTINNTYSTQTVSNCGDYTSPSGNYTWTTSGTYVDTIPNAVGCDSIITFNLTINSNTFAVLNPFTCSSYTSPSGDYTWNTSGTYLDTIPSGNGCSIVFTVNLTVGTPTSASITSTTCVSFVSPSGNYTWTSSGTYLDTIPNASGCDSLMTFNLIINQPSASVINPVVCSTYTSPSGNYTWSSSGSYTDTILNSLGCDSIIAINLSVNNSFATISTSACNSYTSPSGKIWTASGMYNDTIPNTVGCDSILTINLSVGQNSLTVQNILECGSYTWSANGLTYLSSGTHTEILTNVAGCDSIVTLNLTINQASSATQTLTPCNSFTAPSGNYTWTSSGTYLDTIPNANGCDSIITFNLTILQSTSSVQITSVCNSYQWPVNGSTYNVSGIYVATIPNAVGCDSIITLDLTINQGTTSSQIVSTCNSYTWAANGVTYNSGGIYMVTIPNAAGCDSVMTLDLTINGTTTYNQTIIACDSYTSPSGNYIWTSSGTYNDTIMNGGGCDSVIITALTVNNSSIGSETVISCGAYMWATSGVSYSTSGNYTFTSTNAVGCDSVITLNLTVNNNSFSTQIVSACNIYLWAQNNTSYTIGGQYFDTIPNGVGCDSILTLDLTINNSDSTVLNETVCGSYFWVANSQTYTNSGTYVELLNNSNGCDSTVILNLTIHTASSSSVTETGCDSYLWSFNGVSYTASGTYIDTVQTSLGCDSVVTLNLTVNQSSSATVNENSCGTYTAPDGTLYNSSGQYTAIIPNSVGCDSTITINLSVTNIDTTVIQSGFDLIADTGSYTYQWIDCKTGNNIVGATNRKFTPTQNGSYAVEITNGTCLETSGCHDVTGVGVNEIGIPNLRIYPNPVFDNLIIEVSGNEELSIAITDNSGKLVYSKKSKSEATTIDFSSFSTGVYFVRIVSSKGVSVEKVVKR